jgi:hypothetical protein
MDCWSSLIDNWHLLFTLVLLSRFGSLGTHGTVKKEYCVFEAGPFLSMPACESAECTWVAVLQYFNMIVA